MTEQLVDASRFPSMTASLDPEFEQLHLQHREVLRNAPSRRESRAEGFAALAFVLVAGGLILLGGSSLWVDWAVMLPLLAALVLFSQAAIPVGPASTTPVQVILVPLWFAVDPVLLPAVVAFGAVGAILMSSLLSGGSHPWQRAWIGIPDAWCAVGPALVFLVSGTTGPASLDLVPVFVAALAAQFVVDGLVGMLRTYAAEGVLPVHQLGPMVWTWSVDAALAPIGLLLALAVPASPWLLLSVLPVGVLAGMFARERDERIESAHELSEAYRGTAQLMGDVLEADDAYTGGEHTHGVVELSLAVGRQLGLDASTMRRLEFGALLHDIGKLRVPNEIINKPGKLTSAEWEIVKQHPGFGQQMLEQVGGTLAEAGRIVRSHHERWDGTGYPDSLAGEAIPVEARIITVCDSFSAMTTTRSYRRAMTRDAALNELRRCAGGQFDPAVVRCLEVVLGVPARREATLGGARRQGATALA